MLKIRSALDRMTEARDRCAKGFGALNAAPVTFDFASVQEAAEWLDATLGPCPPRGQLRRIDLAKGYAPGNLQWSIVPPPNRSKPAPPITAARQKYLDYLQSEAWKIRREMALEAAGYACQLCPATRKLDVHHRTYSRLFGERLADLTVLCRDCHGKFHDVLPPQP